MRKIETEGFVSLSADEPDENGSSHEYIMSWREPDEEGGFFLVENVVLFQRGPIIEVGVNGVTLEDLLAIVIDRLEHFQAGPLACSHNAEALKFSQLALEWMKLRTAARKARGVEGTNQP
jgi:hypothetical protein